MATKYHSLEVLINDLRGHCGTGQYLYELHKRSVYTDGFKDFKEQAGAYWLQSIIDTEVFGTLQAKNVPDSYYLKVECYDKGDTRVADLKLVDYRKKVLWERHIDYTDLPKGKATFTCGWDGNALITCLMSEN